MFESETETIRQLALQNKYDLRGANLRDADLRDADLSGANLRDADLRDADLSGADLSGAKMTNATLTGTIMPGFSDNQPKSLAEAAEMTKEWLAGEHWTKGKWIETPTAAYNGDCLACLHGAAVYVGGPFGPELSQKLEAAGYTMGWNDAEDRTLPEVLCALDEIRDAATA